MTAGGYNFSSAVLSQVRARVYLNAKTQISCSSQPPNATALPAARCNARHPARGHGSPGATLFIYRHPTREVVSSPSGGAGAEGNTAPGAPPPSLYKQVFLSSWPHLPGTAAAERLPRPQLPLAGLLQGGSFFRGVICTREIQQAKSYRVFLHTTVETVTELYLSVTVVDAYLLFTDCRILPITSLVGTDTRRNMHSGETITKDVYTALSTFIVLNTFQ